MAKQHNEITGKLKEFIGNQKIFFVGTATESGRVNISPKGMDSLLVLGKDRIVWLNVTGSGNETSAHIQENPRMTIMFTAFDSNPMVLRLYGNAKVIHKNDAKWNELYPMFKPLPGARQIFDLSVDLIQTSCGFAVPVFNYAGEREQLNDWAVNKGDKGIEEYWGKANKLSIDGKPTNIIKKNT